MKRLLIRSVLVLGLVAGCLVGMQRLAAQESAKQDLPKAEDILDREVEATGGKAAYEKIKSVVTVGKLTIQDNTGRIARYQAANKTYQEISIDGVFKMEGGVNGDVAWEKHSITGARLLKDAEKAKALRETDLHTTVNWRKHYKKVQTLGVEAVAGKPAYKVELTTVEGETVISHYDKQSGLQVRQETTIDSPEGAITMVIYHSDFRTVNGIVQPFAARLMVGPTEILVTVERVEYNVDIPAERFALPADVNRLVELEQKR